MAAILYFIIIIAFTETIEKEWVKEGLTMIQLKQKTNLPHDYSQLICHKRKLFTKGSLLHIFYILYVDDGTFTFEDRTQLVKVLRLIYSHFGKFGLEMHISRGKKASKTEYIFFHPPGFFGRNTIHVETGDEHNTIEVKTKSESHENKCKREEKEYTNLRPTLTMYENMYEIFFSRKVLVTP